MFSLTRTRLLTNSRNIGTKRNIWNWKIGWLFKDPPESTRAGLKWLFYQTLISLPITGPLYYWLYTNKYFQWQIIEKGKSDIEEERREIADESKFLLKLAEKAEKPLDLPKLPQWPPPFPTK